jgi:transcriptional regulator with XRE-family HTH domain
MSSITDFMTNDEIMRLLGERMRSRRLARNIPVDQLADKAGLNRKTILDMEAGRDVRLSSLVKLLRGLNSLASLEAAFPDVLPGGESISSRGQPRIKASSARRKHGDTTAAR